MAFRRYLLPKHSYSCSVTFSTREWAFDKLQKWTKFYVSIDNANPNIYIGKDPYTLFTFHVSFPNELLRTAFILKWL